jgi:predicted metal-dependent enzyme (double-stranded beta helix superfamily)
MIAPGEPESRGETGMAYTLEQFCKDCRDAIKKDPGNGGREAIRDRLAELLKNQDFVAAHCGPERARGTYTLYHDAETDFHVLSHCFDNGSKSPPHDHGRSWAIYGQVRHHTDIQTWKRLDDGSKPGYAEIAVKDSYRLNPGQVGIYHPGDIHTVDFPDGTRFVRVTGTDLNKEAQAFYNPAEKSVKIANVAAAIDGESESRGKAKTAAAS